MKEKTPISKIFSRAAGGATAVACLTTLAAYLNVGTLLDTFVEPGFPKYNPDLLPDSLATEIVEYEGVELGYVIYGNPSDPMAVLIHGSPGSASTFHGLDLEGMFVVSAMRSGYGDGDEPETSLQKHGMNVRAVIDDVKNEYDLDVTEPIRILGHSYGATVALSFAAQNNDLDLHLILSGGGTDPSYDWFARDHERFWLKLALGDGISKEILGTMLDENGYSYINSSVQEMLFLQDGLKVLDTQLENIKSCVTIFHHQGDSIVPVEHAYHLFEKLSQSNDKVDLQTEFGNEVNDLTGAPAHRIFEYSQELVSATIKNFPPHCM